MKKIFLIEDHDEALKIWREKKIKGFDLVHIDAHVDFEFYTAKSPAQALNEAKSVEELKKSLEYGLAFRRYENDFSKQTNIGNYIFPAMQEGLVKDFYWVIPGGLKEFKQSLKMIKEMLEVFSRQDPYARHTLGCAQKEGMISTGLLGRKFVICVLEKLPILAQKVLLDIDTDFLVVDSLLNADAVKNIGERKPWIFPKDLTGILKTKIIRPEIITIAYSVNGGFTPMKYKYLGDAIANGFSPKHFAGIFKRHAQAAKCFDFFQLKGGKEYYQSAIKLNPTYCAADNNYGPLYLRLGKLAQAKGEFENILKVDPKNPFALAGLGEIYLQRKVFSKAKQYFSYALKQKDNLGLALFGLAQVEFRLNNFKVAEGLFVRYRSLKPLEPQSYYFVGRIYEQKRNFKKAIAEYQHALRLGLSNIDILGRLLKIALKFKTKCGIINTINFTLTEYKQFKQRFSRVEIMGLKKKPKDLREFKKKILFLDKMINKYTLRR